MYLLSHHPVWIVLKELELPDEIINIIMAFKTYYSPIKQTFIEYDMCLKEYDIISNGIPESIYARGMVNSLIYLYTNTIYDNNYSNNFNVFNNFSYSFINNNLMKYNESPRKLILKLIKYIGYHSNDLDKTYRILNNKSPSIENIKLMVGINLKSLILINYIKKIGKFGCIEYDIDYYDMGLYYNYDKNKFRLDMLWYNICHILKIPKLACKTDILMFNYMMGLNYKKSWTKKKLLGNLFKNECDNSGILEHFIKYPEQFNMNKLHNTLNKYPFSSPQKMNSKGDESDRKTIFDEDKFNYKMW